ncbi:MAG: capsid cement protein [Planctomycetota bacterium]
MKNKLQKGDTISVTPTAAGLAGNPILIGDMPCVPVSDYSANETVPAEVEGVYDVAKEAGVAIALGALCYLTPGGRVTTVDGSGANKKCGFASAAAQAADATVHVKWAI